MAMSMSVLGLELMVPVMVTPPAARAAAEMTGKFWRSLAPVSASPRSLAVVRVDRAVVALAVVDDGNARAAVVGDGVVGGEVAAALDEQAGPAVARAGGGAGGVSADVAQADAVAVAGDADAGAGEAVDD